MDRYKKYTQDDSLLKDIKIENKILIEEIIDKGIRIDLWNINFNQNNDEKEDLNSLNNIINWIEMNNNILPNIDSTNEIERINANILRRIQKKYKKYTQDDSLLKDIKLENKILIEKIINKRIQR